MQFHFHANQSHYHKNGFALRLALKQRHKGNDLLSKTKTKVITLANHKGHRQSSEPIKTRSYVADAKRGKMSARESRLVLPLLLIGRKRGASFFKPIVWRSSLI